MRKQIKFVFQIGYAAPHAGFERDVIASASSICGGCTTRHATGWWRDDGDERKAEFVATLEREHCFELELTCEPGKADGAYDRVCHAIADAALAHDIATDWVHVTETEMAGRHFSVAAMNAHHAIAAE